MIRAFHTKQTIAACIPAIESITVKKFCIYFQGDLVPMDLRRNRIYQTIYMTAMYSVIIFLGPFLLILILNFLIGMEIHRARLRRHSIGRFSKARKTESSYLINSDIYIFVINDGTGILSVFTK